MYRRNIKSQVSAIENNTRWRLRNFSLLTGYPVQNLKYLRKIGPPLQATTVPVRGSEVFVHRIPTDALEDELFWFFQRSGDIYEIRLMLTPSGLANRGFAFVRYFNPQQAQNAIATLGKEDFRPHHKIFLESSAENNRLFLSGVPLHKTKTEIWDELFRVGVQEIVDVIVYRGYKKSHTNRGFVFIEFQTHEDAATAKHEFSELMRLWNQRVILDWAEPMREIDSAVMAKVTRVFVRNLDCNLKKEKLLETLKQVLDFHTVEKVYKHMDYSFIHFFTREMAEKGLKKLQEYFWNTDVEVTWSKPPAISKKRILPPRLQKKTKNNHTKSVGNKINEINVQFQHIQFQQTSNKESDNTEDQNEKLEEFMQKSWLYENSNCTSEYNKKENYDNTWKLWQEDFDWFDCCVGHKCKSKEKHAEDYAILTEPCYVHGRFNEKDQREIQSWGWMNQHSANEKRYSDLDLLEDTGTTSFRETANQTFNLRFHLDLYEKRGVKYNAS